MQQRVPVGIVGASGYSGMELTRLLLAHPHVELRFVTSDRWVGKSVETQTGIASNLSYFSNEQGVEESKKCRLVFLATPAETSLELVPVLRRAGVRVIDLAGSFRLKDRAQYSTYYKFEHPFPELLAEATYGLPELNRAPLRNASLVANPGCYATAVAMAAAPLLKEGLIEPNSLVVSAASGVSGAGRKASEEYAFMEIDSDFRAYRTLKHQHVPEIEQTLGVPLVFTPHLLPLKRGILSTAVATLKPGVTQERINQAFSKAYGQEPLVRLKSSADAVRLADAVKTPWCIIGATADASHVVVVSAIDNLLKGAASQAVQNMNLMLGFAETESLGFV